MYYEINVSRNGSHFFATAERSIMSETKSKEVYRLFKEKFPKSDGYEISVSYWSKTGKYLEME